MKKLVWTFIISLFSLGVNGQIYSYPTGIWEVGDEGGDKVSSWTIGETSLSIAAAVGGGQSFNRNAKHWVISPSIQLALVSNVLIFEESRLSQYRDGSVFSVMIATYSESNSDLSEFVMVQQWTSISASPLVKEIDLSPWSGQLVQIAFQRVNEGGGSWNISDLQIMGSDLNEVSGFKVSSVTTDQLVLGWEQPENDVQVILFGGDSEITESPIDGQVYTQGASIGNSEILLVGDQVSYIESGLGSFKTRFYKIWAFDSETHEYTKIGSETSATTTGLSTIFYENFENLTYAGDDWKRNGLWSYQDRAWTVAGNTDGDSWNLSGTGTSYRGAKSAFISKIPNSDQSISEVPGYNYPYKNFDPSFNPSFSTTIEIPEDYQSLELSFFWKAGGQQGFDFGRVFINDIPITPELYGVPNWKPELIDITEFIGKTITLKYSWTNSKGYNVVHNPGFCVDDIMITGKIIGRPKDFSATVVNSSTVDLNWSLNTQGNDVMIAYSTTGIFGSPDDGQAYNPNGFLPGGGEILYKGNGTSFSHEINAGNRAYYRIWSVNQETNLYSTAVATSTVLPASLPFFDDFEEGFQWNVKAYKDNGWYRGRAENFTSGGAYSAYVSNNNGFTNEITGDYWDDTDSAILELPINLAGYKNIDIEFRYKSGSNNYWNHFAHVTLDNGSNSSIRVNKDVDLGNRPEWTHFFTTISSDDEVFAPSSRLRFLMGWQLNDPLIGLTVDNVKLTGELNPILSPPVAVNEGRLENLVSWNNVHETLEAVVVAFRSSDIDVSGVFLTSGERYYVGDIVGESGRVVFVGTGEQFKHAPVIGDEKYFYVVYQKNGLTYSVGKKSNVVTTPKTISLVYEDFEDGGINWINVIEAGSNKWFVANPSNISRENVAFVTKDEISASYSGPNDQKGEAFRALLTYDTVVDNFKPKASTLIFSYDYIFHGKYGKSQGTNYDDNARVSLSIWGQNEGISYSASANNSSTDWKSNHVSFALPSDIESFGDQINIEISFEFVAEDFVNPNGKGFIIDNVSLVAVLDDDSKVVNGNSSLDVVLKSIDDERATAVKALSFGLKDEGADLRPTVLQQLVVVAGLNNELLNWRDVLAGASLFQIVNGTEEVFVADGMVQSQSVVFEGDEFLSIPNGQEEHFVLKVWAKESLDPDVNGKNLQFLLSSEDLVASIGSSFKAVATAVEGNPVSLNINATELQFLQEPSFQANKNIALARQPIIVATDANGNVDNSYTETIGLNSAPTGLIGNKEVSPTEGLAEFTELYFPQSGQFRITAIAGGLPMLESSEITVADFDGETISGTSYINAVRFAGIDTYTERGDNGYELLVDNIAYVTAGNSYNFDVLVNVKNGERNFNIDVLILDESGTKLKSLPPQEIDIEQDGLKSLRFSVVLNADNDLDYGTHRLRVKLSNENNQGEIEDYTLVFTQAQWTGMYPAWDIRDNWSDGKIPSSSMDDVYIPSKPVNGRFFPVFEGEGEVNKVTIERDARLTLKPGSQFTINGDLVIEKPGGLILESKVGPNGLASLITEGSVSGEANVKLDIEGGRWYYLSSAVKTPTFAQLGAAESPFKFRIDIYRKARWISIYPSNSASRLRLLEGFIVKNSIDEVRNIDVTGELNSGEIVRSFAESGWHLFGNPYPSAINWSNSDGIYRENIQSTIWYRTQIGSELVFVTFNGTNMEASHEPKDIDPSFTQGETPSLIPAYQAVWVRTTGSQAGSITINNNAREHSLSVGTTNYSSPQLKSSSWQEEVDRIRILATNQYTRDASVLVFGSANYETFGEEDSEKYFNSSERVPEVYTRVDGKSLAINGMPKLSKDSYLHIPISVRNKDDSPVTLRFNLDGFSSNHSLALLDNETGEYVPLTNGEEYNYNPTHIGDNHDRFVLTLTPGVTTDLETLNEDEVDADNRISIKSIAGKVLVSVNMEVVQNGAGVVELYSLDGRKITEVPARSSRTLVILPNEGGVYIVRAKFGNLVKSERVLSGVK